MSPVGFRFEKLNTTNHSFSFTCEDSKFDKWFRNKALESDRLSITQTYLMIGKYKEGDEDQLLGFYSIKTAASQLNGVVSAAEKNKVSDQPFLPLAEIKYLARHIGGKGRQLGPILLLDAFEKIVAASDIIGIAGIYLVSTSRKAGKRLYEDAGFEEYGGYNRFLPIEQAKAIIGK